MPSVRPNGGRACSLLCLAAFELRLSGKRWGGIFRGAIFDSSFHGCTEACGARSRDCSSGVEVEVARPHGALDGWPASTSSFDCSVKLPNCVPGVCHPAPALERKPRGEDTAKDGDDGSSEASGSSPPSALIKSMVGTHFHPCVCPFGALANETIGRPLALS